MWVVGKGWGMIDRVRLGWGGGRDRMGLGFFGGECAEGCVEELIPS